MVKRKAKKRREKQQKSSQKTNPTSSTYANISHPPDWVSRFGIASPVLFIFALLITCFLFYQHNGLRLDFLVPASRLPWTSITALPNLNLLSALILWLSAGLIGHAVCYLLNIKTDFILHLALSLGLGSVALGMTFFLLAALGLLSSWSLSLVTAALCVLSVYGHLRYYKHDSFLQVIQSEIPQQHILAIPLIITLILGLVAASAPVIFFDALVYHIALPKLHLIQGSLSSTPFNSYEGVPMLSQFFMAVAMSWAAESAFQLAHFGFAIAICLTILGIFPKEKRSYGYLASLAILTIPIAFITLGAAGTDLPLSFYILLGIITIGKAVDERPENSEYWFLIAGFLIGAAMATKYTVWAVAVFLPIIIALVAKEHGLKQISKLLFYFYIGVFIVVFPWIVKNTYFYGQPLFPALTKGSVAADYPIVDWLLLKQDAHGQNLQRAFKDLTSLYNTICTYWVKNWAANKNISYNYGGPIALVAPVLVPLFWVPKKQSSSIYLYLSLAILVSWTLTTTMVRFYLPFLCIWVLVVTQVIASMDTRHWLQKITSLTGVTILIATSIIGLSWGQINHRMTKGDLVVFGQLPYDTYLASQRPTYPAPSYAAKKWIELNTPKDAKILLVGETRGAHLNRRFIASTAINYSPLAYWANQSRFAHELHDKLKKQAYNPHADQCCRSKAT